MGHVLYLYRLTYLHLHTVTVIYTVRRVQLYTQVYVICTVTYIYNGNSSIFIVCMYSDTHMYI